MKHSFKVLVLGVFLCFASSAHAKQWITSAGLGLTVSPTLLMINPQIEFVHRPNLFFGPMIQAGLGDGGSIFTFSGTARYLIGHHPKFRPFLEGGLGLAVGSAAYSSSVGVHIMFGMGADYIIDSNIVVGTSIRANLAPPLDTFFLSWPLAIVRFVM